MINVKRAICTLQVLLQYGIVGLKSHRLAHEVVPSVPPWDEFQVIEESWSGMRCEIEKMMVVSEQLPTKVPLARPPFTVVQLRRMVRPLHRMWAGGFSFCNHDLLCRQLCMSAVGEGEQWDDKSAVQVETANGGKGDTHDSDYAWALYRQLLHAYTLMRPFMDAITEGHFDTDGAIIAAQHKDTGGCMRSYVPPVCKGRERGSEGARPCDTLDMLPPCQAGPARSMRNRSDVDTEKLTTLETLQRGTAKPHLDGPSCHRRASGDAVKLVDTRRAKPASGGATSKRKVGYNTDMCALEQRLEGDL
jgi:hypothetical protein